VGTQPSELDDFEAVANPARNRFGVVMILAEAPPVGVLLIDNASVRHQLMQPIIDSPAFGAKFVAEAVLNNRTR